MKVSVYAREDGLMDVLLQASAGKGLPPVLVQGVTADNTVEKVGPAIDAMRRPKGASIESPE